MSGLAMVRGDLGHLSADVSTTSKEPGIAPVVVNRSSDSSGVGEGSSASAGVVGGDHQVGTISGPIVVSPTGREPSSLVASSSRASSFVAASTDDEMGAASAVANPSATDSGEDQTSVIIQGLSAIQDASALLLDSSSRSEAESTMASILAISSDFTTRLETTARPIVVETIETSGSSRGPNRSLALGPEGDSTADSAREGDVLTEQEDSVGSLASETADPELEKTETATRTADLLSRFSPFDRGALERSIDDVLESALGNGTVLATRSDRAFERVMMVGLAAVAVEALRRRVRDRGKRATAINGAPLAVAGDDASYFPGLPGLPPSWEFKKP